MKKSKGSKSAPKKAPKNDPVVRVRPMDSIPIEESRSKKKAKTTPTDGARVPRRKLTGDLVTFALRLPLADRDAIHKAAGPGRASSWAHRVMVAAAKGDLDAIKTIIE